MTTDAEVIELHRKLVVYHMKTAHSAKTKAEQVDHLDLAKRLATQAHALSDRTGLPIQCAMSCEKCRAIMTGQSAMSPEETLQIMGLGGADA
jgi:hypothetical protein